MTLNLISHNDIIWVNIEKTSVTDINYLKKNYSFHPLALEDCLSRIERPKIDEYDDHLFIVMHFPVFNAERQINQSSEVDIFISEKYLVILKDNKCQRLESSKLRFKKKI